MEGWTSMGIESNPIARLETCERCKGTGRYEVLPRSHDYSEPCLLCDGSGLRLHRFGPMGEDPRSTAQEVADGLVAVAQSVGSAVMDASELYEETPLMASSPPVLPSPYTAPVGPTFDHDMTQPRKQRRMPEWWRRWRHPAQRRRG